MKTKDGEAHVNVRLTWQEGAPSRDEIREARITPLRVHVGTMRFDRATGRRINAFANVGEARELFAYRVKGEGWTVLNTPPANLSPVPVPGKTED